MFKKKGKFGNFTGQVSGKPGLGNNVLGKFIIDPINYVADGVKDVAGATADGIGKITAETKKVSLSVTRKVVPESVLKRADFRSFTAGTKLNPTEKSIEEMKFMQAALKTCFLFETLGTYELTALAGLFERVAHKKGDTVVEQDATGDHFYVLYGGTVVSERDGERAGTSEGEEYYCFGEMSLLYKHPWATSIIAETDCILFRMDYNTFRSVMEENSKSMDDSNVALLRQVQGLKDLDIATLGRLGRAMQVVEHEEGAVILDATLDDDISDFPFTVVKHGKLLLENIHMGGKDLEDFKIGPGEKNIAFGWAILNTPGDFRVKAKITAQSPVQTLCIDKDTFREAVGDFDALVHRMTHRRLLNVITIFKDSQLEDSQLFGLVGMIRHKRFWRRTTLYKAGQDIEPALCFVKAGTVTLADENGNVTTIEKGGYFGDDGLLADQNKEVDTRYAPQFTSRFTVVVTMDCALGVLTLEDCRKVCNTTFLGLGKPTQVSALDKNLKPDDISRHVMLGAGSFGQVWLATAPGVSSKKPRIFALKVQSKHQLISTNQAGGVVGECNIMATLKSPFIIRLYQKFQDKKCIFMLTSLLQGGELGDVIDDGLSEVDAKFYAAGILEGLTYMHQKHIIHRDLKPENVLIDAKGYPVIIDLGFAKYVTDKTFTCCGTPMYIAPEVVNFKGHDKGADHWSWGCMVYEMITGDYAFYEADMTETHLFKKIGRGEITVYGWMSLEVKMLLISVLDPNPVTRLGSKPSGWFDLMESPWFKDVDFKELRRQSVEAPWVPKLKNPLDSSNFEDMSHVKDKIVEHAPILSEKHQNIFKPFGDIIPTPKF